MRKIIHVDMDCFYAAVEMRNKPHLQGKAVAVAGPSKTRGVLSTCNYEARRYGCRSAMPVQKAFALCPHLVLSHSPMSVYKEESEAIFAIFRRYTDSIEAISLDEAFLDVSDSSEEGGSATLIAEAIRKSIWQERHLTASAGIATNKFLAKVASDLNKPNGIYLVEPGTEPQFAAELKIEKIWGVGKVMSSRLHQRGIFSCSDLLPYSEAELVQFFGKMGTTLFHFCRGEDLREVKKFRKRKSLSIERTFEQDLLYLEHLKEVLHNLYPDFCSRLNQFQSRQQNPRAFKSLFCKLKFQDFSITTKEAAFQSLDLAAFENLLLDARSRSPQAVRLLGIGVRFDEDNMDQFDLFDNGLQQ